jgi:signal transduction histidine kinase
MDELPNEQSRPFDSGTDEVTKTAVLPTLRSGVFRKYVILFILAVGIALHGSGMVEVWSSYRDHNAWLIRIQQGQAEVAAAKIGQFVEQIQAQLGWTTQFYWTEQSSDEREADALRVLRLMPAVMELSRLDLSGHEQLHVSRVDATVEGSNADFSRDAKFVEAMGNGVYYGPVYFRDATEPYMTLAVGRRGAGVAVAEISLKYIWDVVSSIKVGVRGAAFVVDAQGKLIAHPDLSLVLRNMDVSSLAQVQAARVRDMTEEPPYLADDLSGRKVLTANAAIAPLRWLVFVELPIDEAYAPLYASLSTRGALLLGGLVLAALLSLVLARRMVRPIQALQAGAARIGAGGLDHRIDITTGDELQALGAQFNNMASQLQDYYATLEGKVVERTRQLELANMAKTRFLAAASHDLRQPLHALGLLVAQLGADTKRSDRRRIVAQVGAAIAAMNGLFTALLDISKLDAGSVETDVTAFAIGPLLRRIEELFAADIREKSLRLRIMPTTAWVRSDPVLLERILLNLVSNAVRYTKEGGILIGCRHRGDALRIEVWDTGIGIPQDQRQNIFREFYQVPASRAAGPGLGLGLAIVDRLCRLLQHPLELTSIPGKGSRFSITVPCALPQIQPIESEQPLRTLTEPFADKLIVVIDDDKLVVDSMSGLLRTWGARVFGSSSSTATLTWLSESEEEPDLIISDYHLADGETGIAVIEHLRGACNAQIPALLITGDVSVERKQEAAARGYDLLLKPVPPMTLRAALNAILIQRNPSEAPKTERASASAL